VTSSGPADARLSSRFVRRWAELEPIGRARSGGYRRYAWTSTDAILREWFAAEAGALGLDLVVDRAGNQWAWWGDPDSDGPGIVSGSHLDSVPDGGAFDGPLGVVSALLAVEALQESGFQPARPVGVVNFADEEGARFGVACAGSRVITGALAAERARDLRDIDGVSLAEAMSRSGQRPDQLGRDDETLSRVGAFVELHVEQGRALADAPADADTPDGQAGLAPGGGAPVGVATAIWPHGRWRFDFCGEANHAGTTRLSDRHDAMLDYARAVLSARDRAIAHGSLATFGKVQVEPNGVNAIPALVRAWLDARGPDEAAVVGLVGEIAAAAAAGGAQITEESWTGATEFDQSLSRRVAAAAGAALRRPSVPLLGTGAGHDAGILAGAGIPAAMLFVRNPTGVSHSPAEHAELDDCLLGAAALIEVLRDLSSGAAQEPA
jgi:N-carbamoyl-L-amino-acid hydrolase